MTFTTFSEACFVFVNVHTTFSPASMSSVALRVASSVDESAPAPEHSRSVSDQPGVWASVTVYAPSCAAPIGYVCSDGSVAFPASVSSVTDPPASPRP